MDSTDNEVEVRFIVVRGASQIGGYIDGYAQERVRHEDHVTGFTHYSAGWPDFVGPTPERFYWDELSAEIVDIKSYDMSKAAVQNKPVGFVLADVHQTNRLVIKDCAGEDQYFQFPAKHFQMIKSGPDTWKLVEP